MSKDDRTLTLTNYYGQNGGKSGKCTLTPSGSIDKPIDLGASGRISAGTTVVEIKAGNGKKAKGYGQALMQGGRMIQAIVTTIENDEIDKEIILLPWNGDSGE